MSLKENIVQCGVRLLEIIIIYELQMTEERIRRINLKIMDLKKRQVFITGNFFFSIKVK